MTLSGLDVHAEHGLGGQSVTTCQKQEPRVAGVAVSQYSGNSGRLTKKFANQSFDGQEMTLVAERGHQGRGNLEGRK